MKTLRVRIPALERHPWSDVAFLYIEVMDKAKLPVRILSYTGAPYLMMEQSKWAPFSHLFHVGGFDDFIHIVIGPIDALDKYWTRAILNIGITGCFPPPTEEQKSVVKHYDYLIAPTGAQSQKLWLDHEIKAEVVPPDSFVAFLERIT